MVGAMVRAISQKPQKEKPDPLIPKFLRNSQKMSSLLELVNPMKYDTFFMETIFPFDCYVTYFK